MAQQTKLSFETNRLGAHQNADKLVSDLLRTAPSAPQLVSTSKVNTLPFRTIRQRMA
jgi:hypothetical protein